MRTGRRPSAARVPRAGQALLLAVVAAGFAVPVLGILLAVEAAETIGLGQYDFVFFIAAVAILGGTSVIVGATILWRKPGNRIGLVMVIGGLLLMSVFTAWPISIVRGAAGDAVASGLANWWGSAALLPAIALVFPTVGILFPDERLPGPRWRAPIIAGVIAIGIGTVLQTIAPWRLKGDFTLPNPLAISGVPVEVFELGGGLSALGTFLLFGIAAAAVVVRLRRSTGVERAQQKWLVAAVVAIAIAFPLSFATSVGPDALIDLLSVFIGALVPIAVGIAILRYHLYEIDRIISRTIAYTSVTVVLLGVFGAAVVLFSAALASFANGQTIAVAGATLVAYALFQPVLRRVRRDVDRRFDRARYDGERMAAAFSDRLRDETDLAAVTSDVSSTIRAALAPADLGVWIRTGGRG